MKAVVGNSVLNPLATCFVPSSQIFNRDKTTTDRKSIRKESNTNEQTTVENPNRPICSMDLTHIRKRLRENWLSRKNKHSATMALLEFPSVVPENIPKGIRNIPTLYTMEAFGISYLILLAVLKLFYNLRNGINNCPNYSTKSCPKSAKTEESKRDEKCCCPPMFGWVLPPAFFGNPLNLKYDCCKNYVHSTLYLEKNQMRMIDVQSMRPTNKFEVSNSSSLEQNFPLEFQMIVKDGCKELNGRKNSVWNDILADKTWKESSPLVDDGTHQLLELLSSRNSENKDKEICVSIRGVEGILEKCLPGKYSHPDNVLTTAICNPPCSVWCECLPSGAKATFLRFLSKSQTLNNAEMSVGRKSVSKRDFYADDVPMYVNLGRGLNSSILEEECEKRLLVRKDPFVWNTHRQVEDWCTNRVSPFDGADSLWQPLPDCIPASKCSHSQNFNRRGREMGR